MLDRFLSNDAKNFRPSAIRAFARWINDPSVISFAGGSPNPQTFPAERFAEIAARILGDRPNIALQYGPTRGLARLCEFVASRCGVKSDQVILTTGSQQALDLIAHTLLDPGDVVAVELPSYIGGTSAFYVREVRAWPACTRTTKASCPSRSPKWRASAGRNCSTSSRIFKIRRDD